MLPDNVPSTSSFLSMIPIEEPSTLKRMVREIEICPIEPPLGGYFLTLDLFGNDEIWGFVVFVIERFPIEKHLENLLIRIGDKCRYGRLTIWLPDPSAI